MSTEQQTTTLDALDASLAELTKAAKALDTTGNLSKALDGVQIDSYGHVDERGETKGGYPEGGDIGSMEKLDEKLVGKLTAAGANASQINTMLGYIHDAMKESGGKFVPHTRPAPSGGEGMKGKAKPPMPPFKGKATAIEGKADDGYGAEDDEEEDEEDEDERGAPPAPPMPPGKAKKSFAEDALSDPDIKTAVDVSPFLEGLVTRTSDAMDALDRSLAKSAKKLKKSNAKRDEQFAQLGTALVLIGRLAKSQAATIEELGKRLGIVEKKPDPQRGVTTPTGLHKALSNGMPGAAGAAPQLKKSEVVATLSYMNLEKGIRELNGRKTSDLIGRIEGGGDNAVDAEVLDIVNTFLRTHPAEARMARTYA